ncbi:MAG: SpoIID/LytB domain-containing protein [Candidatus Rokuibacteriota bacterium]
MNRRHAVLLALALVLVSAPVALASGSIRVALVQHVRAVELRGIGIEVTGLAAGCPRCNGHAWRADTVRAVAASEAIEADGRRAEAFRLVSERPIRLDGREYSAPLELVRIGDGLAVVNELPLEEYLVGVLRGEMSERFPPEALRAQAIVARTYAAYFRMTGEGKPFHIVAATSHQQFFGRVPPSSPLWTAVTETAGQVLRWEGAVFPAFYHAESGGYTEESRNVFSGSQPALKAVRCAFSGTSPHFHWALDLRLADLGEMLRRHGLDVGAVRAIAVTERTASLRAVSVTVRGSHGIVRLRGNDFRRMIGYETLKSTLFAVAVGRDTARFSGRGYGHGVGMCQWGARAMAEQGHTAAQILAYYYPGAVLGTLGDR